MADAPMFTAIGAIRCCFRRDLEDLQVCGKVAAWMGEPSDFGQRLFYCDEHRTVVDQPIEGELLVRRISVTAEVIFCGTSRLAGRAQAEAYAQLERAVAAVGGVISLGDVRSVLGRYTAPAAQGAPQLAGARRR